MLHLPLKLSRSFVGLVALLTLYAFPTFARAQPSNIRLVNQTNQAVVVQASSIVGRSIQRARPQLLQPRTASAPIVMRGKNVVLAINAPRAPTRPLYRKTIPSTNLKLAIKNSSGSGRIVIEPIKE